MGGIGSSARSPAPFNPAQPLACGENDQGVALLQQDGPGPGPAAEIAWVLKASFDANESSDPERAVAIARTLQLLAESTDDPSCMAVAAWTRGMADQLEGQLVISLSHLEQAEAAFVQ